MAARVQPHLEGELVDGVNLIEVVQNEIQQGRPLRSWPVGLSCLIDFKLCDFCLLHLKTNKMGLSETSRWTMQVSRWAPPTCPKPLALLEAILGGFRQVTGTLGPPVPLLSPAANPVSSGRDPGTAYLLLNFIGCVFGGLQVLH